MKSVSDRQAYLQILCSAMVALRSHTSSSDVITIATEFFNVYKNKQFDDEEQDAPPKEPKVNPIELGSEMWKHQQKYREEGLPLWGVKFKGNVELFYYARSGKDALVIAATQNPDLVALDWRRVPSGDEAGGKPVSLRWVGTEGPSYSEFDDTKIAKETPQTVTWKISPISASLRPYYIDVPASYTVDEAWHAFKEKYSCDPFARTFSYDDVKLKCLDDDVKLKPLRTNKQ